MSAPERHPGDDCHVPGCAEPMTGYLASDPDVPCCDAHRGWVRGPLVPPSRPWDDVAAAEGWAIFECSDGRYEIERDDDANLFPCDLAAIIHVYSHAVRDPEGPHRAALEEWKRLDPVCYEKTRAWIFGELP